jgi:hypothetical protein
VRIASEKTTFEIEGALLEKALHQMHQRSSSDSEATGRRRAQALIKLLLVIKAISDQPSKQYSVTNRDSAGASPDTG